MDHITQHPFSTTWWVKGAIPGVSYLYRTELLNVACRELGVLAMSIELALTRARVDDEYHKFLDDIEGSENNKELRYQMKHLLADLMVTALKLAKTHPNETLDEEDLEEHAKTCKKPDCPVKKIVEVADKIATDGLNLTKSHTGQ